MPRNQFSFFARYEATCEVLSDIGREHEALIVCRVVRGQVATVERVEPDDLADFVKQNGVREIYLVVAGAGPKDAADLDFRAARRGTSVTVTLGSTSVRDKSIQPSHAITERDGEAMVLLRALDRAVTKRSNKRVRHPGTNKLVKFLWTKDLEGWDLMGYTPVAEENETDRK